MTIDIMTIFPEICENYLNESIIGRARKNNLIDISCENIRDYSLDTHKKTDDTPYGGGTGMIMTCQPIADCFRAIEKKRNADVHFIYMSPKGKTLTQKKVKEISEYPHIAILCGRYEGVDQRVLDKLCDEEISIGDYVITGGELPALVLADAVSRMIPGVLRNEEAAEVESHFNGLLEYPQYTKPYIWETIEVPDVLISGNHKKIFDWRRKKSLELTLKNRPDMLSFDELSNIDKKLLKS